MHALRIFLSSPGDLTEERGIARDVIEQVAGSHLVRSKVAIQIVAWDDRHASAPMNAGETPQLSVNRYTGLPDECDLTVVILWSRIGTPMPPCLKRADGSPVESGTVWEYENALQAGRPVFVYRKTATPQIALDDPQFDEKRTQYTQVKRFFEEFRNPDGSLRAGVNDIANADAFRTAFRQHLEAFLKPYLEQMPVFEPTFRWPTIWDFSAYMAEKRDGFAGREWLFGEIAAWLADPTSRALLIRADFGVGKSAFLSELLARNSGSAIVGWHFCQHDTRETLRAGSFVHSLAAQLRDRLPGYREQVEAKPELQESLDRALEDPGSAFEAAVLNPLAALPEPGAPRLIVIDALDEALEVDTEDAKRAGTLVALLANKARRLPSWLRVIVTSRNNPEVITRLQQAFSLKQIDAEGEHNRDDLYTFALDRAGRRPIATQLAAAGKTAAWLAALLRNKAGGKFLYVVRALRDIEDGRLTLNHAQHLPPGMDSFYLDAFERRFERAGRPYEPYRALLGLLCALREPVAADTLAEILGCDASQIKQTRALLPDFIVMRLGGYTFEHLSIAEWLSRENEDGFFRAGPYAVDLAEAALVARHWAMRRVAEGTAHRFDYLIRQLAFHLPDIDERRMVLAKLMLDYRWLKARLKLAGVDALISDCRHLGEREEAQLLAACLRNASHVLRRNPEQFAAQLLGRLQDRVFVNGMAEICNSARAEVMREVCVGERAAALLPTTASLRLDTTLQAVLEGHEGWVTALAVLPDGRLASAGGDGTVRLWDLTGGSAPQVLAGHDSWVTALAALPDRRLASASEDGTVRLWDLAGSDAPQILAGHDGSVRALTVLPDGRLASAGVDGTVRLWDLARSGAPKVLAGHNGEVYAITVLPDGCLASAGVDDSVQLWNLAGRAPQVLAGHDGEGYAMTVLPDGRLASAGVGGSVQLWDLAGSDAPQILAGHDGAVRALTVLPDGRLASASEDGTVRLWDLAGNGAPQILAGHNGGVYAIVVLPDGRLASAGSDLTVRLWNVIGGGASEIQAGHEGRVSALAVLPDGRLASAGADRMVRLWDLAGGGAPEILTGIEGRVSALAALPDGRVASAGSDNTVRLWDLTGGSAPLVLAGHDSWVNALAVLPDGRLASAGSDNTVRLWDLTGDSASLVLAGHDLWVSALAVLPDGRLASAGGDSTIRLWDLTGSSAPQVLTGHDSWVSALAALPDGRLASASSDGTVSLWDLVGSGAPSVLAGHDGIVNALAVLPSGDLVLAVGQQIQVQHLPSGAVLAAFETDATISTLLINSSGRLIAGDASGRLHFFDLIESPRKSSQRA